MANVFTNFGTAQNAARNDLSQAPNIKQSGGRAFALDLPITGYTAATANPLFLVKLPANSRLLPHKCSVTFTAPSSTAQTVNIGYYTADTDTPVVVDAACFGTGLVMGTSAGHLALTAAGTLGTALLTPIQFPYDVWIVVTPTTVTAGLSHSETWHIEYTNG